MKRREVVVMAAVIATSGMAAPISAQMPPSSTGSTQTPPTSGNTASTDATPATARSFSPAQLDQMLAPIALYPDDLLAQILMAATYPVEVVEAARWSKDNPALKGETALAAVKDKGWDVSVASLVAFPQVLQMMASKLDWVQNVGDAMLSQQSDVAASVQRLRAQAKTAGTLKTTPQQTVVLQPASAGAPPDTPPAIVIQPANPETIYVPSYDSVTAYGPWPYPDYPPTYFPPPSGWGYGAGPALIGGLAFGVGMAVGGAFFGGWGWGGGWGGGWGWRGWDAWGGRHSWTTFRGGRWAHDPAHRRGVPYRNAVDRDRFGQNHPGAAERAAFRGGRDGEGRGAAARAGEGRGAEAGARAHAGAGHHNAMHNVNHARQARRAAARGHASGQHAARHAARKAANHGGAHHGGAHHGGGGHHGGGHHGGGGHGGRR